MWRSVSGTAGRELFDGWVAAYKNDTSSDAADRQGDQAQGRSGIDGCYDKATPPTFIAEQLTFTTTPATKCSALYPVYANPRFQAGGPLSADVLKCQLKPVDAKDYKARRSRTTRGHASPQSSLTASATSPGPASTRSRSSRGRRSGRRRAIGSIRRGGALTYVAAGLQTRPSAGRV